MRDRRPRPLLTRVLSLLLGAWVVVLGLEPASLHVCPMHAPSHAAARAPGHDTHAAAPAGHAHAGAATTESPAPAAPAAAYCVCLGDCAGADSLAPATPVTAGVAFVATAARAAGLPDRRRAAVAAPHVLPFANGPPSRALVTA